MARHGAYPPYGAIRCAIAPYAGYAIAPYAGYNALKQRCIN